MTGDLILYEMLLRGLAVSALAATIIGWRQGGPAATPRSRAPCSWPASQASH
uniref:Uncharacterized protein n=1 Tax=Phenylobacterium glaciei TaxID=2803784 RepID=A0A974P3C5_9CAUL|nr:hypothetical protein JKL49_25055 [Phenylobacterium glaciei]